MFSRKKKQQTPPQPSGTPKPAPKAPGAARPKLSLLSLESRLMFDAAAAATAAEVNQEQVAQEQAESAVSAEGSGEPTAAENESQDLLQAISSYNPGESTTEVVFVDPTVPDYQSLIAGMGPNVQIVMLDGGQDGMEQIAASLTGRTGIDAIHIISHGAEGQLSLGTGTLTTDSMTGEYADELAAIQQALSAQADILVYGCDFANGLAGQDAVTLLSQLTGADVAASTDDTGYAGLGGDWEFEIQTGTIETQVVIDYDTQADWVGLLAGETPPTISNLSGDSLAYSEGSGAVVIEQGGNVTVSDVDSTNFNTGTLTVSIPSGGDSAEDVLSIRNQGTGAGQIGVSGSNVTYGGVIIGTFTGGSSGSNLVITLNSSATPTAVTALVKNITYQNTDTNSPTTGARTVRFVLTDGDGGTSANYNTTVTVSGVNDAPADLSAGIELNTDGGNDAYLISDTGLSQSLTATTVEIRFAANDLPLETVLMSFNNPSGDELSIQLDEPANDLELDFGAGNVALASAIDYRAALVDGAVHTLSVTWDNAAGNWSVYIDGVHIESGTGLNVGTALDTTNGRFVFGQEQDGQNSGYDSTQYFSGTFYDVRIWNDVRTAGEIAQYYEQQLDVTPAEAAAAGLVANWQMDGLDGSNQVVELVSGNNLSIAHASGTGFTTGAVNSQLSIDENSANGSHVGFVVAGDPDASETFSYSLTDSAGGRFAVDSITGEVTVANGTLLNYESATSHSVSVRVTDSGGLTYDETLTINLTNVAESPIANDDTAITMVNAPVTIDVIANDTDPEGDAITVLDYTVPANGTVTDNLDGTVTYTPDTNYQGADSFNYLIADSSEAPTHYWRLDGDATDLIGGSTGVVNGATTVEGRYGSALSFDEVNDYVTLPDVTYPSDFSLSFMLKVDDLSGTSYQYLYSHGVFNTQNSINVFLGETGGTGPLLYTRVLDTNDSAPATTSFDVSSIVGDGQWHTYTLTISASAGMNVYLDGDLKLSDSARGKDGINPSGDAYLGARQDLESTRFFGGSLDSVAVYDYALSASQVTNLHSPGDALATVTVTVEPNSAPTDLTLSANTVAENVANGTIVGTVTGTDPNVSDTKSYSFTDSAGGRFAINSSTGQITVANGSLLNYEAAISHTVTVRVTDAGGLTYDETVTINLTNVNETPTGADATVTLTEDTSHTLTTANFGFGDVDAGDSLSAVRIDTIPIAGTLTLSGVAVAPNQVIAGADITAGNLVFTPAANANGTGYASFTFSVRDSNNAYDTAPNTLTVNVTAVNDAPINTVPGAQTVAVDTPLAISGLLVSDIDGNLTTVQLSVTSGTVAVSLSGGATISSGASGTATLTLIGTQADINATLGSLIYQGNSLFTGTDTLTVLSTDGNGASDTDTVTITVSNDGPSNVLPAPQTVAEDTPLALSGLSVTDADGNLTTVQLSVSYGTVSVTLSGATAISGGSNGSGTLTLSGTQAELNATLASLTYQGNPNFSGTDTLAITSIDSIGTADTDSLSITVTPTSDAPTDLALSGNTVAENAANGTVVGTVSGTDPDSGDTKSYSFTDSAGGRFAINSSTGQITVADGSLLDYETATSHSVTVRVTDAGGLTYDETVTINLTNVNETPVDLALSGNTVAENAANGTVVGTVSGTDPDSGDTKSYSFTDSAGGRFAINSSTGQITVADGSLLNYEAATSHSVTVRVTDAGGLTYDETVTINLTNVNETPTGADATVTINEDASHSLTTANFGFSDVDAGDSLSAVWIDTIPTAGTLTLSGALVTAGQVVSVADITAGNLVFTPAADANGTGYASFTFSVRDSNNAYDTAPNTLTFNVTAVNDVPMAAVNAGSTVAEGGTDTIDSSELAVTDSEQTAAQLTYAIGTGPAYGRLELTTAPGVATTSFTEADIAANRLVYVHNGSETTSDSFTFTVSDGAGGSLGSTTVTLIVTPVNDAPTITSGGGGATASYNVAENITGIAIVTGADVDLPAQALTYSISGGVDQALFTVNAATGALSFVAPPDFEVATDANGDNVYVVQVRVTDSQGASTTQTIQVTVADVVEGVLPPPTPPPVLLPTTPPSPTGSGPVPSRPLGPAEPPIDALPQAPVLPDSRSAPAEPHPATVLPSPTERLAVIRPEEPRATIDEAKDSVLFPWIDEARRLLFTGLFGEPTPTPESEPAGKSQSVSDLLFSKLNEMTASLEQAMGVSQEQHVITVRIAALTGTTLSAGFIAWALRSGTLLASFMATMPAWRHFDPLPVLGGSSSERERRKKEAEQDQQAENTEFKGLKHLLDLGRPPDPKP